MRKHSFFALAVPILLPMLLLGQQKLGGIWEGSIQIMGQELRILVNFVDDTTATIDIPPQGAAGLKLVNVRHTHPGVHFELPAGPGLAVFDGKLDQDSIKGSFTQSGMSGSFRLGRGQQIKQEVIAETPVPYRQEEVVFYNDTLKLAGTLTIPPTGGRHPAVVMITGSGPQNRDEELFGFKPFRMIADHFTRQGIAVLRYDDRGVGGSGGNTMLSTTSDFADDIVAAVKFLQARSDINPKQIGLCGHSEGGIVAPLAATRDNEIAFIVLMSGTGVVGMDILLAQSELIARAEGATETDLKENMDLSKRMFSAVRAGQSLEPFREEMLRVGRKQLDQMKPDQRKAITNPDEYLQTQINAQMKQLQGPWLKYFISYDPAPTLERVQCPVLALFGELDLQVPAEMNKHAMERALKKGNNKDHMIKVFPKANHLYLTATTGSPSEYASLKKEFVPGFLETMSDWILRHVTVVK